jgi:pescadillo
LQFVIRCCGGAVSWESEVAPFAETDEEITHQIVDRPQQSHRFLSREYVQPQWIYDSVNANVLLPLNGYLAGETLPPHLSPFVSQHEGSYLPDRAIEINNLKAKILAGEPLDTTLQQDTKQDSSSDDDEHDEDEHDEEESEARYQRELEAEAAGLAFSKSVIDAKAQKQAKKDKKKLAAEREKASEAERNQMAEIMIPSKKDRRLYQRIQTSKARKEDYKSKLAAKRDVLKEKKPKQ